MTAAVPGNNPFLKSDSTSQDSTGLTLGEKANLGGLLQVLAVIIGGAALLKVCVFDVSADNVPMLFAALIVATGLFFWGDALVTRRTDLEDDDIPDTLR